MISFIVPAHNEQSCIGRTLQAIHATAGVVGQPHEMIVVDDASTDATADIARQHKATVLSVNHRQIAAARNAGVRVARGDRLFFVDADTTVNSDVVKSALRWMDKGAAGGGALARFDGPVPLYARLLILWMGFFMRLAGLSGGACMFCTRNAFQAVGGFDECLYGAEDAAMSSALKREGRFVVVWPRVVTSGRRVRTMPGLQVLRGLMRMAFFPSRMLTQRSQVQEIWYNSARQDDERMPGTLAARLSNAIALSILLVLVTTPIWIVPWPRTLTAGPLGSIRFGAKIILAHMGLVLWPCAFLLSRSLLHQRRWRERFKLMVLIGLSLWFACTSTVGVYWTWKPLYHWLAQ